MLWLLYVTDSEVILYYEQYTLAKIGGGSNQSQPDVFYHATVRYDQNDVNNTGMRSIRS